MGGAGCLGDAHLTTKGENPSVATNLRSRVFDPVGVI